MRNLRQLYSGKLLIFITLFMLFSGGIALAAEHRVGMKGWKFNPDVIEISAGDTVLWVNDDDTTHKLVFEDETLGGPTKDSPERVRQGREFSFTFKKAGEYRYYCVPHLSQDMKGKVIVK